MPPRLIRQALAALAVAWLAFPGNAHAGCSPYIGAATLNEFYHDNQSPLNAKNYFVEAKLLDSALDSSTYGAWSLLICSKYGPDNSYDNKTKTYTLSRCITGSSAIATAYADTSLDSDLLLANALGDQSWLVLNQSLFPAGYVDNTDGSAHGMEVFLLDENDDIIDYTQVAGYSVHAGDLNATSCNYLYDNTYPGNNTFHMQRLPDGTGCWPEDPPLTGDNTVSGTPISCIGATPPTGGSTEPTEATPNTESPTTGSYPYLAINDVTVLPGGIATFTVSIAGVIEVTSSGGDLLYTYDSSTHSFTSDIIFEYWTLDGSATTADGDYLGVSASSRSITAGSSSVSIAVNTNSSGGVGEYFNAIIGQSSADTSGAFVIDSTGTATFIAPSFDHYSISHSTQGVTCEAEAVTITAHDAGHNAVAPAAFTRIVLSTTPTADGWSLKTGNNPGSFNDLGGGSAEYILDGSEHTVEFWLRRSSPTTSPHLDIDVSDGSYSDPDGDPGEDPALAFVDSALRFYAGGVAESIARQIGGKSSHLAPGDQQLSLRAVQTNTDTGACEARLSGTQTVQLAYECIEPATCASSSALTLSALDSDGATVLGSYALSDNPAAAVSTYQDLSLKFDATGTAYFRIAYQDSGRLRLHARQALPSASPDPAATLSGASNVFAVVPFALDIDFYLASDGDADNYDMLADDWADDGLLNNSTGSQIATAADADGSKFTTAGSDFSLQYSAVLWQAGDDLDNDGLPDAGARLTDNAIAAAFGSESTSQTLDLGYSLVEPAGGDLGTLTSTVITVGGGASSFSAGQAAATLNWSEVGIIDINASLSDYLGSGADVNGLAANTGRFVPAAFDVAIAPGALANTHTGGATDFTYIGESFGYASDPQLTIRALNSQGAALTNYTGALVKLSSDEISLSYPSTDATTLGTNASPIGVTPSIGTRSLIDNGDGSLSLTLSGDSFVFDMSYAEIAPFNSDLPLTLNGINESTDSVSYSGPTNFTPLANYNRRGRARLSAAFGEDSPGATAHPIFLTEYFDGSAYIANADDVSSSIDDSLISCSSSSALACNGALDGSDDDLSITPATLRHGEAFTITNDTGEKGTVTLSLDLSALGHLQYDWDGDGSLDSAYTTPLSFGLYRGDGRFLYWREVEAP